MGRGKILTMVTGLALLTGAGSALQSGPKPFYGDYKKTDREKVIKVVPSPVQVRQTDHRKYTVTFTFTMQNPSMDLSRVIVILPYPDRDVPHYQSITRMILPAGWRKLQASNGETYVRYIATGSRVPAKGGTLTCSYEFDVVLHGLQVNGSLDQRVTATVTPENRAYLGAESSYIDPENREIKSISASLRGQSGDSILTYARKAYEYVASSYGYRDAYTGLHPVADILRNRGGDCGNLSSVFISLMRTRNVPARHLVAISPTQNYHAWAEFWIDGAGWVPVDVTYKNHDRSGDYFGRYRIETAHIVMHKRLGLDLEIQSGQNYNTPILQNFAYWVYGTGDVNTLRPSFKVTSRVID